MTSDEFNKNVKVGDMVTLKPFQVTRVGDGYFWSFHEAFNFERIASVAPAPLKVGDRVMRKVSDRVWTAIAITDEWAWVTTTDITNPQTEKISDITRIPGDE